ncbi:cobyric acid synthase [Siculibacillus lacustris]|uniref:Cobyric acid synthase n=2 Tax=Siculibacillus lacustris TaxID=1549641 RepID=A0A4Q9VJ00_9HYPH|nr:cobyric acid synthase [Siculibacillus lacustris]
MIQGTGSDVGKSLIVAGLIRAFADRGLVVRPFKPQNMSNNAAVTADGGEIGRAQALQARAARIPPSVDMNPVLLKPQSDVGAQVVVRGKVIGNAAARDFQTWKPNLATAVAESFARLRAGADLVIVEGAGSAAEVNLRAGDIANMGFAASADVPVILLGDIDRGGVIAQLVGTQAVIDPADAARIVGFLVNKFRGDPALFASGMTFVEDRTGWPALGLIPWFGDAVRLPAEDAVVLETRRATGAGAFTVVVPRLPHIANFDDLDPLTQEPGVRVVMLGRGEPIPASADLVLLPGSKATIADLAALRAEGWDIDILAHVRRGGRVLGICGGYQMLGRAVADPDGLEGPPAEVPGLGLLDVATVLGGDKHLESVAGTLADGGAPLAGYEMHVGVTDGPDRARPFAHLADGRREGAVSRDGRVAGCYLHGLFADDRARAALLAGWGAATSDLAFEARIETTLDALAAHVAAHVDLDRLWALAR